MVGGCQRWTDGDGRTSLYVGLGGGSQKVSGDGQSVQSRRWLYRSPALDLSVEAGCGTGRWDSWYSIGHVSLAEVEDSNKDLATLITLAEDKGAEESIAGLTVHRLAARHVATSASYSTGTNSAADSMDRTSYGGSAIDNNAVADTWLSCRLVSGQDDEGSAAKVLIVSSALLAVNRTFLALQLKLVDTVKQEIVFEASLNSGQCLSFPILPIPARRVKLFVRPAGANTEWEWCTDGPRLSFIRQAAYRNTTIQCRARSITEREQQSAGLPRSFYARLNVFRSTPSPIASVSHDEHHGTAQETAAITDLSFPNSLLADDGLYTLAFDPPLAFKNMLGCELDYQVTLKQQSTLVNLESQADADTEKELNTVMMLNGTLPHRQEVHWYSMDLGVTSAVLVSLSLRRAAKSIGLDMSQKEKNNTLSINTAHDSSLSSGSVMGHLRYLDDNDRRLLFSCQHEWSSEWSPSVIIHSTLSSKSLRPRRSLPLHDHAGRVLHVSLDYSDTQSSAISSSSASSTYSSRVYPFAGAGPGLVTAYVPYWMFNNTGLPLAFGIVDQVQHCHLSAGQSESEILRQQQLLQEAEDAEHKDIAAEAWYTFSQPKQEQVKLQGLQLLLDIQADQQLGGSRYEGLSRGWNAAMRRRPYDQSPFLLSYPDVEWKFLDASTDSAEDAIQTSEWTFRSHSGDSSRRACIRLPNTDWSKPFSVDAVGTHGAIELEEEASLYTTTAAAAPVRPSRLYELGVSVTLHPNPRFHRTKMIVLHPRVILHNVTGHILQYRQVGTRQCDHLLPHQQVPVHRYDSTLKPRISLKFASYGWQWCATRYGIAVNEVGTRSLRVRNNHTHDIAVVRVDTKLVQATFEVTVMIAWEQQTQTEHRAAAAQPSSGHHLMGSAQQQQQQQHSLSPARMSSSVVIPRHLPAPANVHQQLQQSSTSVFSSSATSPSPSTSPSPPSPRSAASSVDRHQLYVHNDRLSRSAVLQSSSYPVARESSASPMRWNNYPNSSLGVGPHHSLSSVHPADDDLQLLRNKRLHGLPQADSVPYRVENFSLHTLLFYQVDEEHLAQRVLPYRAALYAWDEPEGTKELVIAVVDPMSVHDHLDVRQASRSRPTVIGRYSLDKIVKYPPVSIVSPSSYETHSSVLHGAAHQLSADVYADGRVRVLRLTDARSGGPSTIKPESVNPVPDAPAFSFQVHLAGVGISIITHAMTTAGGTNLRLKTDGQNNVYHVLDVAAVRSARLDPPLVRQELLYLLISELDVKLHQSKTEAGLQLAIGNIQIDNQLHSAAFPVVFCPVVMKQDQANKPQHKKTALSAFTSGTLLSSSSFSLSSSAFLVLSIVKSFDKSRADLWFFPYFSVRMQKMQLNVEEELVAHLLHFMNLISPALSTNTTSASSTQRLTPSDEAGSSISSSATERNIISEDLMISSSQLFAAQQKRSHKRRAAKATTAAAAHPQPGRADQWEEKAVERREGGELSSLQYSGSVRRRTTVLNMPYVSQQHISAPLASSTLYETADLKQSAHQPSASQSRHRSASSSSSGSVLGSSQPGSGISLPMSVPVPLSNPLLLYFQKLLIHPVQVNVSYSATVSSSSSAFAASHSHPLRFLLRALNVTILNVDNAPLRLSSLQLEDVFSSSDELLELVRWHYLLQLSTGVYKLLGSSDLLGNPVGLFTSISSGLQSFFYEPALGLVHSPQAFTSGIAKGTLSLVQHSLYGLTNTTRGVMSSIAKGLASLTMTTEQQPSASRRSKRHRTAIGLSSPPTASSANPLALMALGTGSVRALLGFAGGAVDLVSSLADRVSHAVNPQAKATRCREPTLFELGLLTQQHPHAVLTFINSYLRQHPTQLYYCQISQTTLIGNTATTITAVLLTSRLLLLQSRGSVSSSSSSSVNSSSPPVLIQDFNLADLVSIRNNHQGGGAVSHGDVRISLQSSSNPPLTPSCTIWYQQIQQGLPRPVIQQLTIPLRLPAHLVTLLSQLINAANQPQELQ